MYYNIILDEETQKLYTIVLTYGKYTYQVLIMGTSVDLDVFQDKISTLFQDMVHVCVYIYDLVIISNDMYKNYMDILYDILN